MAGASKSESLSRAIVLVSEALDILDAHSGSPEAAVHLDLALEKMRQDLRTSASKPDK